MKSAQPLPILQAGNWRKSHERTPVNCPHAGHRTVFTAGNGQPSRTGSGATGTGKTVSLQNWRSDFPEIGVPVFMADVKGDLTGIAKEGQASEKLLARLDEFGVTDWNRMRTRWCLGCVWSRAIRSRRVFQDLGPLLLARLLNLNEVQSRRAQYHLPHSRSQGLLLLDDFKSARRHPVHRR
ncbi:helicase HerA-like domain-containing protein [Shigella flexneri]